MLLAIDSCGAVGGVALGELSGDRTWSREMAGRSYSESLLATLDELLREAGIRLSDLRAVVVVSGPGSFTGIRIGVSAAKGLAEALAIPVIGPSRLGLLARRSADGSAVAVLDAGRGEFFVGFYRDAVCETEALLTRDALSQAVMDSGRRLLVCEAGVFAELGDFAPSLVAAPTAVDALAVGATRFLAGDFDDVVTLDANYLRRSENEMLARIAGHAARKTQVSAMEE